VSIFAGHLQHGVTGVNFVTIPEQTNAYHQHQRPHRSALKLAGLGPGNLLAFAERLQAVLPLSEVAYAAIAPC
jgi:hypothetical protein